MNEREVITELLILNKRLVNAIIKYVDLLDAEGTYELVEIQQQLKWIEMSRL